MFQNKEVLLTVNIMKLFVNGKVGEAVWKIDTTSMWILSWIKREFEVGQAMKLGEKGWYGFKRRSESS